MKLSFESSKVIIDIMWFNKQEMPNIIGKLVTAGTRDQRHDILWKRDTGLLRNVQFRLETGNWKERKPYYGSLNNHGVRQI